MSKQEYYQGEKGVNISRTQNNPDMYTANNRASEYMIKNGKLKGKIHKSTIIPGDLKIPQ